MEDGDINLCVGSDCGVPRARARVPQGRISNMPPECHEHAHYSKQLLQLHEVWFQTYAEARLLVFSLNTFTAGSIRYPKQFLADDWLYPSQEAAITRLDISANVLILCNRNICAQQTLEMVIAKAIDRSDLKCLKRFSGLQKIVVRLVKLKDYFVHNECEVKPKQEFEEAIKQEGRAIKVEYQDVIW